MLSRLSRPTAGAERVWLVVPSLLGVHLLHFVCVGCGLVRIPLNSLCQLRLLLHSKCLEQCLCSGQACLCLLAIDREGDRGITLFHCQSYPSGCLPRVSRRCCNAGVCLGTCGVKLLCNLNRAEAVVRRHYASMGISSEQMNYDLTSRELGLPCLIELWALCIYVARFATL